MNALTSRSATDEIAAACAGLEAVGLDDLVAEAELLTRVDRKHLLPVEDAVRFLERVPEATRVLELAGERSSAYETTYFDTPDRLSHRMAATRRRRRFKIRVRAYLDTREAYLEVKTRGARQSTVKERIPVAFDDRDRLGVEGRAYAAEGLAAIGLPPGLADRLEPVLVTCYRRTTLVADGARATVDTELRWTDPAGPAVRTPGLVVVETKSGGQPSAFERALLALGNRPVSISKFGVGMAALHPDLPSNRWSRVLGRHFSTATDMTGAGR